MVSQESARRGQLGLRGSQGPLRPLAKEPAEKALLPSSGRRVAVLNQQEECITVTEKKVWFVTGAGRGMGGDIARAALAAGHQVVATGRNPERVTDAIGPAGSAR